MVQYLQFKKFAQVIISELIVISSYKMINNRIKILFLFLLYSLIDK